MRADALSGGRLLAASTALMLTMTDCAQLPPTAAVAIPPVPARDARVWFYRDLDPNGSLATPYVRLNNAVIGTSQAGGAFYRDVPPGHYHISVDSYLADPIMTRDVDLASGQEAYAKVLSLDNWIQGGGQDTGGEYHRDTFYVWVMPHEAARPEIAKSTFYGTQMAAAPVR